MQFPKQKNQVRCNITFAGNQMHRVLGFKRMSFVKMCMIPQGGRLLLGGGAVIDWCCAFFNTPPGNAKSGLKPPLPPKSAFFWKTKNDGFAPSLLKVALYKTAATKCKKSSGKSNTHARFVAKNRIFLLYRLPGNVSFLVFFFLAVTDSMGADW